MQSETLSQFEQLLLQKRKSLLRNLGYFDRQVVRESFAVRQEASYSDHPADIGTEVMALELACHLATREGKALLDIESALDRIKDGSYGQCVECGDLISPLRLRALPDTLFCLSCKVREERIR